MGSVRHCIQILVLLAVVRSLGYVWSTLNTGTVSAGSIESTSTGIQNVVSPFYSSIELVQSPLGTLDTKKAVSTKKFFLLAPSDYTTNFLLNYTERTSMYYQNHLNEESAEIWLHRGFERMEQEQTTNPSEADIILIAGYFHLNAMIRKGKKVGREKHRVAAAAAAADTTPYMTELMDAYEKELEKIHAQNPTWRKTKPHLLLIPSWNPGVAANVGIKELCKRLQSNGFSNLWSVGFERNSFWQGVPIERILPIPYVVRPNESSLEDHSSTRISNFVFYVGDRRPNAKNWAGCHRDRLILPLQNSSSGHIDVRLVTKHDRIEQSDYNHRMRTSDYCLILCGDTPSSRTLTSAMVSGCIPIRVGSRLRGLCEPPCHSGFGWRPTGSNYTHLPYSEIIPWDLFPEVDEQQFMDAGVDILQQLFVAVDTVQKQQLRSIMEKVKTGWIYGWGDPVNSTTFGGATNFIWNSFLATLYGTDSIPTGI